MQLSTQLFETTTAQYREEVDDFDKEEQLLQELPAKFSEGRWQTDDVANIIRWKNEMRFRDYNTTQFLEENTEAEIQRFVGSAITQQSITAKLESLTNLQQVSVATGSAILLFLDPESYTVFDTKAWTLLQNLGFVAGDYDSDSIEQYLVYLGVCKALATEYNIDLRALDRALWVLGGESD